MLCRFCTDCIEQYIVRWDRKLKQFSRIASVLLALAMLFVAVPGVSSAMYVAPSFGTPAKAAIQQLPFTWNGTGAAKVSASCFGGMLNVRGENLGKGGYGQNVNQATGVWSSLLAEKGGSFSRTITPAVGEVISLNVDADDWNNGNYWSIKLQNCNVIETRSSWTNSISASVTVECSMYDNHYLIRFKGDGLGASGSAGFSTLGTGHGGGVSLDNGKFDISRLADEGQTTLISVESSLTTDDHLRPMAMRNCELVTTNGQTSYFNEETNVTFACFSAGNGQRAVEFKGMGIGKGDFGHSTPNGSSGIGLINPDNGGSFRMIGQYDTSDPVTYWVRADNWRSNQRITYKVSPNTCEIS